MFSAGWNCPPFEASVEGLGALKSRVTAEEVVIRGGHPPLTVLTLQTLCPLINDP